MNTYGAYDTIENRPALSFERRLSHPVDVVWRAITKSEELEHWFPSRVDVDEFEPGAEMTFTFDEMPLEGVPTTMTRAGYRVRPAAGVRVHLGPTRP